MQKIYIILILFTLCFSCTKKTDRNLQSQPSQQITLEKKIKDQLQPIFNKLKIESIVYFVALKNLEIMVDFSFMEKNQIVLFSEAIKLWAPLVFALAEINSFSIVYSDGLENYNKTFYIEISKEAFNKAKINQNSLFQDIYLASTRYFIGSEIKGDLWFNYNGQKVLLNVQKPIFN